MELLNSEDIVIEYLNTAALDCLDIDRSDM